MLNLIRLISALESTDIREAAFIDIAGRSPVIRLVLAVYRVLRVLGISHLFIVLFGVKEFVSAVLPKETPDMLAACVYPSEVKQVEYARRLLDESVRIHRTHWNLLNLAGWRDFFALLARPKKVLQFIRVFRRIERRLRFMPACRVVAGMMLYVRFRRFLSVYRPRAVLVASNNSPDAAALALAAEQLNIPTIFIAHALPSEAVIYPMLSFDLCVFDSDVMEARFATLGMRWKRAVHRGILGENRPMQPANLLKSSPRFGIFLSSPVDMKVLSQTVLALSALNPKHIIVRGHPVDFSNPDFSSLTQLAPNVIISKGRKIVEDIEMSDLVIIGNSTAALEVLKHGVSCAYVASLDGATYDYNGFVAQALIPEAGAFDLAGIAAFYDAAWDARFSRFDAGHGRDVQALQAEVRAAMMGVLG